MKTDFSWSSAVLGAVGAALLRALAAAIYGDLKGDAPAELAVCE